MYLGELPCANLPRAWNNSNILEEEGCQFFFKVNMNEMPVRPTHEGCQSFFKVNMNEMPVRPTHDDMFTGHAITGVGLLIPLKVNTIVTK